MYTIYTGLCGIIEFELAISEMIGRFTIYIKNIQRVEHPPFVRSGGKYVGIDNRGKRYRRIVDPETKERSWIDYGWEYLDKHDKDRFNEWESKLESI